MSEEDLKQIEKKLDELWGDDPVVLADFATRKLVELIRLMRESHNRSSELRKAA